MVIDGKGVFLKKLALQQLSAPISTQPLGVVQAMPEERAGPSFGEASSACEVTHLHAELEAERSARHQLEGQTSSLTEMVASLRSRQERPQGEGHEAEHLRSSLEAERKTKEEAMGRATIAQREARGLRAALEELEAKHQEVLRHARNHEEDVEAEKATLRAKCDELEQQKAELQSDLAAVRAAGVLSKSGTLRFEIGGGQGSPGPSRPSTAEAPDDAYRLSKQVRELQDRIRMYQAQAEACGNGGGEALTRALEENARLRGLVLSLQTGNEGGSGEQPAGTPERGTEEAPATVEEMRAQLQRERRGSAQREAQLLAEIEGLRGETARDNRHRSAQSRQIHELQVRLGEMQQRQSAADAPVQPPPGGGRGAPAARGGAEGGADAAGGDGAA
eukprot:CAMPEP_0177617350 /NCGR_PEP_ID=MMETSP0419_2-20121207/24813_1 /TAXON_ID=582737 /ORGANISM="Tetraselmis sp., Strain GSL018" /LENGTH=390 /DNA_ID=CAMNT_0019115811 /DNA_START=1031 /DNA_END=2202 /DNA_ORIENTATION=+